MARHPVEVNGGLIEFVATPSPTALREAFRQLENPSGTFYACVFSDDACIAFHTPFGIKRFNMDISSCDSSHGRSIFDAFIRLFPDQLRDAARILVEQCEQPIEVRDVHDRKRLVRLRPKAPRLYSGSTITTAINNLANFLIILAITMTPYTSPASLIRAAEGCGYIITLQECEKLHDLQFLKHSPVHDVQGCIQPLLNLGVLLRASGSCNGDLPRGDFQTRAQQFQYSLVWGAYPCARFQLRTDMLLATEWNGERVETDMDRRTDDPRAEDVFHVTMEEATERYRLSGGELADLIAFGNSRVGYVTASAGLSRILEIDYGLCC